MAVSPDPSPAVIPGSGIRLELVVGDALAAAADVLVLKYAQDHHGVDRLAVERLTAPVEHGALPPGSIRLIPSDGSGVAAKAVVLVGVQPLGELRYREIQQFGRRALRAAATAVPDATTMVTTLHGAEYGLDTMACLHALLRGLVDAAQSGRVPDGLTRVTIVERDTFRAERLAGSLPAALASAADPRTTPLPLAFLAMPVGLDLASEARFRQVIEPAVNESGFRCERVVLGQWDLLDRSRATIAGAAVLIADLTGSDPVAHVQLGMALERGVPTVILRRDSASSVRPVEVGGRAIIAADGPELAADLRTALRAVCER